MSPQLGAIAAEVLSDSQNKVIPFSKSKYFHAIVDLRKVDGTDRIFSIQARGGNHHHKIELLQTGAKKWDQLEWLLQYSLQPNKRAGDLRVSRADCCTDVTLTVDYLVRSMRCQYKRWQSLLGDVEVYEDYGDSVKRENAVPFQYIGLHHLQTAYYGRWPNPFRVYDKTAETQYRYKRAERQHYRWLMEQPEACRVRAQFYRDCGVDSKELTLEKTFDRDLRNAARALAKELAPFPAFQDWDGNHLKLWPFTVCTRLERQMSGEVPVTISTVKALHDNALSFNPFERITFAVPGVAVDWAAQRELDWIEELAGEMIEYKLANKLTTWDELHRRASVSRTGKRASRGPQRLQRFRQYIEQALQVGDVKPLTAEELYDSYRESIKSQFQIAA